MIEIAVENWAKVSKNSVLQIALELDTLRNSSK